MTMNPKAAKTSWLRREDHEPKGGEGSVVEGRSGSAGNRWAVTTAHKRTAMPWLEPAASARKWTVPMTPPPPLPPRTWTSLSPIPFLLAGSAAPLGPVGQPRSTASSMRAELRRGLAAKPAPLASLPLGSWPSRYVRLRGLFIFFPPCSPM